VLAYAQESHQLPLSTPMNVHLLAKTFDRCPRCLLQVDEGAARGVLKVGKREERQCLIETARKVKTSRASLSFDVKPILLVQTINCNDLSTASWHVRMLALMSRVSVQVKAQKRHRLGGAASSGYPSPTSIAHTSMNQGQGKSPRPKFRTFKIGDRQRGSDAK
jgi:hypothetical protein